METHRPTVDPSSRRNNNLQLQELSRLQNEWNGAKKSRETAIQAMEKERLTLIERLHDIEQGRDKLAALQAEIDEDYLPEAAQPRQRIQKRDEAALEVKTLEGQYAAQKSVTSIAEQTFSRCEHDLFVADKALARFAEQLEDVYAAKAIFDQLDKEKSDRISLTKARVAARKERSVGKVASDKVKSPSVPDRTTHSNEQNRKARKNVAELNNKTKNLSDQMKDAYDEHHQNRIEAVIELKTNLDHVRAEVATVAAHHAQRVKKAEDQLAEQKQSLLDEGLNPYAEFRKKELETAANRREKRMKVAVEEKKRQLADGLEKERKFLEKQEAAKAQAERYEREHRESLGRHVVEERNRQYLVRNTSSHSETLDPSGKALRIDPSQITEIPDYTFGLGHSVRIPDGNMAKITSKIRASLHMSDNEDLGEYDRLVKSLQSKVDDQLRAERRAAENDKGNHRPKADDDSSFALNDQTESLLADQDLAAAEIFATQDKLMPGLDKVAAAVNFQGNERMQKSLVGEALPNGAACLDVEKERDSPRYPSVPLSKFELDAFARAKARQRQRIEQGRPQVVGGKTFNGEAFVSSPSQLIFKDFDIGKSYRKSFTLTNVSYTFNSFKVLELDMEVVDFFEIEFEKPGRMSAGMSCSLSITFRPEVNKDINSALRLQTETGPISIPLFCLIKRCAPRIQTPAVNFGTIIMGQSTTMNITIANSQALPTRFAIVSVDPQVAADSADAADEFGVGQAADDMEKGKDSKNEKETSLQIEVEQPDNLPDYSGEPATDELQLVARMKAVMTATIRRKRVQQAMSFVCYIASAAEDDGGFQALRLDGILPGYGSVELQIRCAPLSIGDQKTSFLIRFLDVHESLGSKDDLGQIVTREQLLRCDAMSVELPIFIDQPFLDYKCTLYDRIYRQKVVVKNRGKIAYRLGIHVPKALQSYVEVIPNSCFVQASGSQAINVRFTPKQSLIYNLAKYSLRHESNKLAALMMLPVEIVVTNQDLPVHFIVQSLVSPSTIALSTTILPYGKVMVGQKVLKNVELTNTSLLPQRVAFVRLKKEVTVEPDSGFAMLLPGQTSSFCVGFAPLSAMTYSFDVQLLTSWNDALSLALTAEGVEAPLLLKPSLLQLRSTAPGQPVTDSIFVTNQLSYTQNIEILAPESCFSWLQLSPNVLRLKAGERRRVEVSFSPPPRLQAEDPLRWMQTVQKAQPEATCPFRSWEQVGGWVSGQGNFGCVDWATPLTQNTDHDMKQSDEEQPESIIDPTQHELEAGPRPEDWGVAACWTLPVMIQSRKSRDHIGASPPLLFVQVETLVALPQFDVDLKERHPAGGYLLDFGEVATGTRHIKSFKIFNHSGVKLRLKTVGLNASGPFTLLRPTKPIAPQSSRVVMVESLPASPGLFVERLEFVPIGESSESGHVQQRILVSMRVQGLQPSLSLRGVGPPPATWQSSQSGLLDFGHVLVTPEPVTAMAVRKFDVINDSDFSVQVSLQRSWKSKGAAGMLEGASSCLTLAGWPSLTLCPEKLSVPLKGQASITAVFRPDHTRPLPLREEYLLSSGADGGKELRLGLMARTWSRQYNLLPENHEDEVLMNNFLRATLLAVPNPPILAESVESIRSAGLQAQVAALGERGEGLQAATLLLRFSDPFAPDAPPNSYSVVDAAADAAGSKEKISGKPPKPREGSIAVTVATGSELRRQNRRLQIISARPGLPHNNDGGQYNKPGSFEVVWSTAARESGLFSVTPDRGNLSGGDEQQIAATLDVSCTQSRPRSLANISIGSWRCFEATVIIRGGYVSPGLPEEQKINISLQAFVSV